MKVLALDVGNVRIGVAIGDTLVGVAHARDVMTNDDRARSTLTELIRDERIEHILVGHPRALGGHATPQTQLAEAFAEELRTLVTVPIELVDERLTSVAAHANLRAGGIKTKEHRAFVDSEAARIILQAWLDGQAVNET